MKTNIDKSISEIKFMSMCLIKLKERTDKFVILNIPNLSDGLKNNIGALNEMLKEEKKLMFS